MNHSPRFLKLAETSRKHVKETTIAIVKEQLDQNHSFFLIDVREDSEWSQGHLPKAIHLSKGIIERDIEKTIPDVNAEIVLYCGGGFRSALAAENLQKMGYNKVISMDGGFKAWKEAGYSLE